LDHVDRREKPELAKFMAEKVVPEMAAAMDQPPYDPATKKASAAAAATPST
jgi:hypothetical protein